MKLFLFIFILAFVAQFFLPWWSMMLVAFLFSFLFGMNGTRTFFAGALACGLTWLIYALFIQLTNGDLMTNRMAALFHLPSFAWFFLIVFFIAAITGGVASWAGWTLRTLFKETRANA